MGHLGHPASCLKRGQSLSLESTVLIAWFQCLFCYCSFKQDSQAASKLLVKSLSDDAKRQLLAALEASQEPPGISRWAGL